MRGVLQGRPNVRPRPLPCSRDAAIVVLFLLLMQGFTLSCRSAGGGERGREPAAKEATPGGELSPGGGAAAVPLVRGRILLPSGKAFEVEVVQDEEARERGLQGRASLPRNQGMLFVFPDAGRHRFWMYECLIPLDILWLDRTGTVVSVEENLPACASLPCPDYGPQADALYVFEMAAGEAARSGILPGQRLELLFAEPTHAR